MTALTDSRRDEPAAPTSRTCRRAVRALAVLVALAALVGAAFALAPTSIGGRDEYIITSGTSMLPTIEPHSFVLIRRESEYHVGDIVAYHNKDLDVTVLHRIVAIHGRHYEFKGDNNSFVDFYRPTAKDLYGRKVVYSRTVGRVLLNLRTPWVGAVLCFAFTVWVLSDARDSSARVDGPGEGEARHGRHRRDGR